MDQASWDHLVREVLAGRYDEDLDRIRAAHTLGTPGWWTAVDMLRQRVQDAREVADLERMWEASDAR